MTSLNWEITLRFTKGGLRVYATCLRASKVTLRFAIAEVPTITSRLMRSRICARSELEPLAALSVSVSEELQQQKGQHPPKG